MLYNYIISDIDMGCPSALTNGVFQELRWAGGVWWEAEEIAEYLKNVQRLRMQRLANMQNLQEHMLTLNIPSTEKIHHGKYKQKHIQLVQHAFIIEFNMF